MANDLGKRGRSPMCLSSANGSPPNTGAPRGILTVQVDRLPGFGRSCTENMNRNEQLIHSDPEILRGTP